MARKQGEGLAYGHESHKAFNRLLEDAKRPSAGRASVDGPWLSPPTLVSLPATRRDFERNRDPFIRAQTQGEERESGEDNGDSQTRWRDKPAPALKPKGQLRRAADRAAAIDGWLTRQRDAAMAKAPDQKPYGRDVLAPARSVRARHR